MENLADLASYAGAVLYASLALIAWRIHRRQASEPSRWVLWTFGLLFGLSLVGFVLPDDPPDTALYLWVTKVVILALLAFPYLMHRLGASLSPPGPWLRRAADTGLLLLGTVSLLLPEVYDGPDAPGWFTLYALTFVGYWALLFGAVGWRLFAGGRGEPTLARRRIRLLAGGSVLMGLALVVSFAVGQATDGSGAQAGDLVSTLFGLASASLFLLGFAPPGVLRVAWREPEETALQEAATELLAATTRDEVTDVLLPHLAALVGARGVALLGPAGRPLATHGDEVVVPDAPAGGAAAGDVSDRTVLRVELRHGSIVGRTSPFSPFVGEEEQQLFRRLGVMADLALERVELLDRLRDANLALEDANQELESFVYSASHDLKNPLIAMLGYLQLLQGEHAQQLDDEARWYLERMTTNGRFMEALIQDLLELSRVGRVEVEPVDLDLGPLLDELREDLRTRHPSIRVAVGTLPRLRLNPTRARQLFANLLENAAKYGGRPDVTVSVGAEPAPREGHVRIVVADDGVGIPEPFLDRVFGVFERLEADDSKSQGTGIGLAICRKIVETAGGTINAEPSDVGARIVIDLPDRVVADPTPEGRRRRTSVESHP